MKTTVNLLKTQRKYSAEFKKHVVNQYEQGHYSVLQLSRLYGVHPSLIYVWIYKISTFNEQGVRIVEMKDSQTDKVKQLEEKIKELERLVGQKQIQVEYLEKMIELAKSELNIDIKKNYNTLPSGGLGKTGNK